MWARVLIGVCGLAWGAAARADQTNTQLITHVLYNGTADYAFFIGTGPWAATGCSAFYAQLPNTQPGKKELLAIIMTAYSLGKRVSFQGSCNSNPTYFDIFYVTVSD
jgi:hypothetical protein